MKSIIVTGGVGHIGAHIVKSLSDQFPYKIHVVDNFSQNRKNILKHDNVTYHEIDIRNKEKLDILFAEVKPETVFHFAALANVPDSVKNPAEYYENNVIGSFNLFEAMRQTGCTKLVCSSSASVYGEPTTEEIKEDNPKHPTNPYGQTKLVVEKMLEDYYTAYGISSISFRYFCAAGVEPTLTLGEYRNPETHIIPCMIEALLGKRDRFYIYGYDYPTSDGTGVRDYIHVLDLADAHIKAMQKLEEESICTQYNLGINKGFSVRELITATENVSGLSLKYEVGSRRSGDPARLIADASRAMKELDWKPNYTNIEEIIKTAYNSMQSRI